MAIVGNMSNKYEGTNNTLVSAGSFGIDTIVGTSPATAATISTLWSPEGSSSLRINIPAGLGNDYFLNSISQSATTNELWLDFYLKVDQAPSGGFSTNIIGFFNNATSTHVGDINVQGVSGNTGLFNLRLRNASYVATTASTFSNLNVGQEYRVSVHVEPGVATSGTNGNQMRVYTGANLHTMTPTFSTGSIAASGSIQPVDRITMGSTNGANDLGGLIYHIDDMIVDNANQYNRTPLTTDIPEWEEGFEAGNVSDLLGPTNSIFTRNEFGTSNGVFVADPYQNTKSVRFGPTTSYGTYNASAPSVTDVYMKFALKVASMTGNANIVELISSTTGGIGLGFNLIETGTGYSFRLRSGNTGTSTVATLGDTPSLPFNEWIEVGLELHITALNTGTMRASYWAGNDRGNPTATATTSLVAMTGSPNVSNVDTLKIGVKSTTTHELQMDVFRADTASMPPSLEPPGVGTSMVVTATGVSNVEPFDIFGLVGTISGGIPPYDISWVQTSGGDITLTGADTLTPTGIARADVDAIALQYTLTVTDSTPGTPLQDSDIATVNILPHDLFWRSGENWRPIRVWSRTAQGGWV